MIPLTKSYDVLTLTMLCQFEKNGKVSKKHKEEQKKILRQIKTLPKKEEEEEFELIYIRM